MYIYSEESRQKSERKNLAHLGTIRISFKDSWHHQVWLRKKAIKDAHLHPVIFPCEKPPTITFISFKLLLIKNLAARKRLNKIYHTKGNVYVNNHFKPYSLQTKVKKKMFTWRGIFTLTWQPVWTRLFHRLGQYSVIIPQYKEEGELGHARLSTDHHRLYIVPTVQGREVLMPGLQHLYIQGPPGMHRPC